MATLGGFYLNPHKSQYVNTTYFTHQNGCTWTSAANGANASSGGAKNYSPDYIHRLVPRYLETAPNTPGWSLQDVDRAMGRVGVLFEVRAGRGWAALLSALAGGYYVELQGDSDQFSNNTCSGAFNGDHAVGIHPATRVVNGLRQHWLNDPICKTGRWEYDYVLRRYAVDLAPSVRFGVFTRRVPRPGVTPVTTAVTLRYGGSKITPTIKRISVPSGQKANVRYRPTTAAAIATRLITGQTFKAYQRTTTGLLLAGSRVWFGNATGTRWLHITAF